MALNGNHVLPISACAEAARHYDEKALAALVVNIALLR